MPETVASIAKISDATRSECLAQVTLHIPSNGGSDMDRKIFKRTIGKAGLTPFSCPVCRNGKLMIKKDTFQFEETALSASAHNEEAWWVEWIDYLYCCLLKCTNGACNEIVSSSGTGGLTEYQYYDEEGATCASYDEYFHPKFFSPHLVFFEMPKKTPEKIEAEVNNSFASFFCDPPAAANHIRMALERLLTHLKIKRFVSKGGKRRFLPLHGRIDLLPKKFDHVKELFVAIKWLGNAGSHSSHEISKDDVLDSYELMDELLTEIFTEKRKKAKSLAKKIIRKMGPK